MRQCLVIWACRPGLLLTPGQGSGQENFKVKLLNSEAIAPEKGPKGVLWRGRMGLVNYHGSADRAG